jgi:hypothetical protein
MLTSWPDTGLPLRLMRAADRSNGWPTTAVEGALRVSAGSSFVALASALAPEGALTETIWTTSGSLT